MKVRIKEFIKGNEIRYIVQYKRFGFIWRPYKDWWNKKDALETAKELEARELPRYWTPEELERVIEQEKK
ncbi:MAG: hypothetical protein HDQ88_12055 [Clostridia bacterium]|nr:hypothetical protein [Clostridia bacterium]